MKKILFLFALMCLLTSCSTTTSISLRILSTDDCIKNDHQYMDKHYKNNYRWYECGVLLHKFLDEDGGGAIEEITNVFQILTDGESHDTNMIIFRHTLEGDSVEIYSSLWVEEDVPMYKEDVNITFREAINKIKALPNDKLHTRHVVLRKQLGPNNARPQYIFGNNQQLIFVDAAFGDVYFESPSFANTGFATWLGEWPY